MESEFRQFYMETQPTQESQSKTEMQYLDSPQSCIVSPPSFSYMTSGSYGVASNICQAPRDASHDAEVDEPHAAVARHQRVGQAEDDTNDESAKSDIPLMCQ